eukprot:gene31992-42691_t
MGILLIGFALTDGFDLGVATLLPFVARTDAERRMVINTVGPTWEGNQVWLILGGGAIFAAWPFVYAVSFSGFYLAMFLVLAALILRPVGFKYRSKHADAGWRSRWDWALFVGGFVPALVFGVAVGNVLSGAPFRFDGDLRLHYAGGLLGLFTPFTLLAGLLSVAMIVLHGTAWLSMKVEDGAVADRARGFGKIAAIAVVLLYAAGFAMIAYTGLGYRMSGLIDPAGPSNPLDGASVHAAGAWLYQEFAMLGDPAAVRSAYNLPANASVGLASGGLPPEGMLYGHSYSFLFGQLLALKTAGFADPALSGPQVALANNAPVWDRFTKGMITSLVPAAQVFPSD